MATGKKFGTFGGVFTPSILTILGVIMYMRMPMIAGEAGLIGTLSIILIAHLISITTGLSVSSIATDKKVKEGGTYYIISRSLGLPIGGTLGLALFVGLSFSISLYLIGFSESLLTVIGQDITPNTIRLAGTIALFSFDPEQNLFVCLWNEDDNIQQPSTFFLPGVTDADALDIRLIPDGEEYEMKFRDQAQGLILSIESSRKNLHRELIISF